MTSRRGMLWSFFALMASALFIPVLASAGSMGPINIGAVANKQCAAEFNGHPRVYTLACDVEEKDAQNRPTGRRGGLNCTCQLTMGDGGINVSGKCVALEVCRADTVVNPTDSTTGLPIAQPPQSNDDGAELSPESYYVPVVSGPSNSPPETLQPVTPGNAAPTGPAVQGWVGTVDQYGPAGNTSLLGTNGAAIGGQIGQYYNPQYGFSDYQPPSTMNTGNWANFSNYLTNLGGSFSVLGAPPNPAPGSDSLTRFNPAYPQGGPIEYGSSSPTFNDVPGSYYQPVRGEDGFFAVLFNAGGAIFSGINNVYESLSGVANSDLGENSSSEVEAVLNESLGIRGAGTDRGVPGDVLVAVETVRATRASLEELKKTVAKVPSGVSSSTPTADNPGAQTPRNLGAEAADAALATAERRVLNLEIALEKEKARLGTSNARVRELVAELQALNERIKNATRELQNPALPESDRFALITAVAENVQLALTDAERRLAIAVRDGPPRSVGQVVFDGLGNVLAGIVQGISGIFIAIWQGLFGSNT